MPMESMLERAHSLFEYIKEVCLLNQQKVLDIDKQIVAVPLKKLDDPSCVQLFSRDSVEGDPKDDSDVLFTFHKPDFTVCPAPDESLIPWIEPGWNDYRKPLSHLELISLSTERPESSDELGDGVSDEQTPITDMMQQLPADQISVFDTVKDSEMKQVEYFIDDPKRVALYDTWAEVRAAWVEREKHTERLRDTFTDLFDIYNLYRQKPDTLEIMIGNGLLTDKQNKEIRHPLLLKRVSLKLDSVKNTLELSDTDEPTQLYYPMFSVMEDVNTDILSPLGQKAEDESIHPLDHHKGADLLKSVAHQIHSDSRYQSEDIEAIHPEERILVRWVPYVFLRKRPDGTIKAIESILGSIDKEEDIPESLEGILGGFNQPLDEPNGINAPIPGEIDTWNEPHQMPLEDEEILLPKPANREQIQIVRQIEHLPAVLVQGPPGTGKTHTIANLLGHFLSKGNTVLVTSHTNKALNVLKDKVPKDLQALCVALLGDNRADMEESINTIIEKTCLSPYAEQLIKVEQIRKVRHQTLQELQKARQMVYAIRHKEFEPIIYEGESWSPSKAADYVAQRESLMGLIPGEIVKNAAFPINEEELSWLYASNGLLSEKEEYELSLDLPDSEDLMTPQQFADGLDLVERLNLQLQAQNNTGKYHLAWKPNRYAVINQLTDQVFVKQGDYKAETDLLTALSIYEETIPEWAAFAISDGAEDGLSRKRWEQLLHLINDAFTKSQSVMEKQLTKPIKLIPSDYEKLKAPYSELLVEAKKHGYVKKTLFMSKERKNALDSVTISGGVPETINDIESILGYLELLTLREQLSLLWDNLIAAHGGKKFVELGDEPERSCFQQRKAISFWVNWAKNSRQDLCYLAETAGIGSSLLQPLTSFISFSDVKALEMLNHIETQLIPAVNLLHIVNGLYSFTHSTENTLEILMDCPNSSICANLQSAINISSAEQYELAFSCLENLQGKKQVQSHRCELLKKIEKCAPAWAQSIRNRTDCHGDSTVPEDLLTAWKVRQLSIFVDEITSSSLSEAEKQVEMMSTQFRKDTEKLASALAWCHLQRRIDQNPSMRQSLNGWKQTMAKIGKGTGKKVPTLRAQARKLMEACQKAVPVWIMPVASVMNTINPSSTKFDVIIVDEASQSDITASAILYMGKKIIVVGDDEQVSPSAVGIDETKMENLMNMLIKDKIPNAHLWDAKTSLYDIAAQVYQPLMLREHFRCVPDIIGYSNMLSYQGKIKPLREAGSSPFKTATVSFRVRGMRKGRAKTNEEEASAIVALIKACIEQPEYQDKSFGIISMLGDDQVKLIGRKLANDIPLAEYEKHQILCGNASNFQGDERDVIFLSLVDSNEGDGPLAMASGEGQGSNGKAMKQRYNVAVSRARDQLWVIHSLDYTSDLKPGDMRRGLLEYIADPHAVEVRASVIDEASDSPFEAEVAKALVAQGYHIVQQWQVGAYYIDMVAICGKKKIGIECDGERWHSGEEKIREDMERQSILERLGWKFIRIRGSEYYRGRSAAISRVISELEAADIHPEASAIDPEIENEDKLLTRVKMRATQLMDNEDEAEEPIIPFELPTGSMEATNSNSSSASMSPQMPDSLDQKETSLEQSSMSTRPIFRPTQAKVADQFEPEQISMVLPVEELLSALTKYGFKYLDNRKSSGLLWVYYDAAKKEDFSSLQQRIGFKATLEKRGAKATNNEPAWCIYGQK